MKGKVWLVEPFPSLPLVSFPPGESVQSVQKPLEGMSNDLHEILVSSLMRWLRVSPHHANIPQPGIPPVKH